VGDQSDGNPRARVRDDLRHLVVDLDGARRSRRAAVPENIALATLAILTEHRGQIVTGRPP
jgi:hypothetical protein